MAQRIEVHTSALTTAAVFLLLAAVLVLLISKHYEISLATLENSFRTTKNALIVAGNRVGALKTCSNGEFIAFSSTVYVCDKPANKLVYRDIYQLYPARGEGREIIYGFLDKGEKSRADEMVDDVYRIERYEPVTLPAPLSWTADPFGERYWRFQYYSLRPVRHLLATARETRAERYFEKTREILGSFLTEGIDEQHAWDDPHGAAFRTMVLVNAWWKLREAGELPGELSDLILSGLEVHGDFLLDPQNYEADYNHGVTQAAALLLLSEAFPELANADTWRETATRRLAIGLSNVIDEDGVLIENSPYYHFYTLEKYWEIYLFANERGLEISSEFNETVKKMISHATYVLQPDLDLPLLGATIPRVILNSGEFREMAAENEEFLYVLTKGTEGKRPSLQHSFYPSSGIAIMRSGWGEERPYSEEVQVLFDTGPYRTDHSDLDALGFSLYAFGTRIVRDAGLFTYETDHPLYDYFHGTRGHNTVVVDGGDQSRGSGTAAPMIEEEGYSSIGATHELYSGVRHSRALMLIEDGALLIIDELISHTPREYEQLFHLSRHAEVTREEQRLVEGYIEREEIAVPFRIEQLGDVSELRVWKDDKEQMRGLCTNGYEALEACHELSFQAATAPNARYITIVKFGEDGVLFEAQMLSSNELSIETDEQKYTINIEFPDSGALDSRFIALSVSTDRKEEGGRTFWERAVKYFEDLI